MLPLLCLCSHEVCQLANKDCAIVWDEEINCWDSSAGKASRGGAGLFNGWYDGCAGMYHMLF